MGQLATWRRYPFYCGCRSHSSTLGALLLPTAPLRLDRWWEEAWFTNERMILGTVLLVHGLLPSRIGLFCWRTSGGIGVVQANVGHKVMPSTLSYGYFCNFFYIWWSRDVTRPSKTHTKLPKTSPPWWCRRLPLKWRGVDEYAQTYAERHIVANHELK